MGGSPIITESSSMVSSPLHVTASLEERLVRTPHFGGGDQARVRIATANDTKRDNGDGFFGIPLSDDSNSHSASDLEFLRKSHHGAVTKVKHVAFGDICTRSYAVVMGDHPCCSMGCPLSLGWEYSQSPNVSVDEYEASRSPRRTREDLKTTWDQRRNMLTDVSDSEVKRAERKLHRERSCQRKNRSRVSAAFFKLEGIPEDCKMAAGNPAEEASSATPQQTRCT